MKSFIFRSILTIVMIFVPALPALTAEYPTKPITLIIPFPAGGSTDLTGRALAKAATKYLGQPIICENKPGGGGSVGPSLSVAKPADGYTIGVLTTATIIGFPMEKLNFSPIDDLTHIMRWGGYLLGIVVRADSPWKNIHELLEYSKQNPQRISYGSPGFASTPHLAVEELSLLTGIQWVHMPYKGIAETNAALLGGHIDAVSDSSGSRVCLQPLFS
jgi:tripartite-type tricarboxylate transporter receptor subunit TctC